ncbi:hemocyte protein-glutamine gamma-glutamyltransferase-like isoform X2 [Mytilus californianus]|nr:hemocyte protein-glutamine gamma-glutamyltransferase-like isoform X2 [Mytilus californianus]XP_052062413.1 hemocyte protein-glutamine gamma-glutamyltransferase-like isoform X2 [Mytilus californianus]XP_052062414.1 hemocyte protein-glutamine gamma-glutamyltransferase-like isoform X2 [Mytilus californianus]XP_052062415.1 hemocyte protein-glutamine gamma-glutamyltransferase-like isoform X2 [Mytilus californianus]
MRRMYINGTTSGYKVTYSRISRTPRNSISRTFSEIIYRRGNRYRQPNSEPETSTTSHGRRSAVRTAVQHPPVSQDLQVEDIDFNVYNNSKDHVTDEYHISETGRDLVVRRGQPFDITIAFNKDYDPKKDDLKLVFLAGDNPTPPKGTRVTLILSDKDEEKEWGAWIMKNEDKELTVRINTPPTCYVGIWQLQVETIQKADNKKVIFEYTHDQDIYILFNPWCKDDQVYQPDRQLLDEYILNDTGKIYTGNRKQINGKKWNFGQFEENILDCAMMLLDRNNLAWTVRGDPVKVARKLSAITNSQDDKGVLVGNWSGSYHGGKSPLDWAGSVAILNEYYKTKQPVRFGQCWVFSGVITTLCRALGIPARSVTNFASAHDCDGSISIDSFWSESGEPIEELNSDSVWNFHVWNDVWMARPDLPPGYGGWQAIDATPQEASDGVYCCGPASLHAIKRGEVNMPYDTPFVFAEVNADRVNWELNEVDETNNVGLERRSVGMRISTKLPKGRTGCVEDFCYDIQREDVTRMYKHEEGSNEERAAVLQANQSSTKQGLYDEGKPSDVEFELVDKETVPLGNDFEILLKIKNNSDEERTISGCISTSSIHYTGVPANKIKTVQVTEENVRAKSEKVISVKVTFNEYFPQLVEQCHMKMSCMCRVLETKHTYVHQDTFRLLKPDITIKAPATGKIGQLIKANVSFTNPIPCTLTNCSLTVEGPGLQEPNVLKQSIVASKQTFMATIEFLPRKAGVKELVVAFNSRELAMVEGSCEITISA